MKLTDLFHDEPGWIGAFTRAQAPEAAHRNGATVFKVREEPGDATPLGTSATVLGSMSHPELGIFYFVEWADKPRQAVGVIGWKLGDGDKPCR